MRTISDNVVVPGPIEKKTTLLSAFYSIRQVLFKERKIIAGSVIPVSIMFSTR